MTQAAAQDFSEDELDVLADELEHDPNAGQDDYDLDSPSDSDMELDTRTPSRDLLETPEKALTPPKSSKTARVKGKHKQVKSATMVEDNISEYKQS